MTERDEGNSGAGLLDGGGQPNGELLNDGQEEVFSRTEVETGRIEHKPEPGDEAAAPFGRPHP